MVSFGAGTRKLWRRELDYALREDLWSFGGNRIAVRFQYKCHDAGQWYRSCGMRELDQDGYMRRHEASINDVPIGESKQRIFGPPPPAERDESFRCADRAAGRSTGLAGKSCASGHGRRKG
jgi:hypothetical protein